VRGARIPAVLLRPVVQNYLDKYQTAETEKIGNWTSTMSPIVILADEANMPERSLRYLLAGTFETIDFDRADRLLCAMGLGVLGWLEDPELRHAYYAANLSVYDEAQPPSAARPGEHFVCGCERSEENSKPTKTENGRRYYACRRHYNENKRLARLNYGRAA
jgi:hypothetical protein